MRRTARWAIILSAVLLGAPAWSPDARGDVVQAGADGGTATGGNADSGSNSASAANSTGGNGGSASSATAKPPKKHKHKAKKKPCQTDGIPNNCKRGRKR